MTMRSIPKKDRGNGDRFNNTNRQPEKCEYTFIKSGHSAHKVTPSHDITLTK